MQKFLDIIFWGYQVKILRVQKKFARKLDLYLYFQVAWLKKLIQSYSWRSRAKGKFQVEINSFHHAPLCYQAKCKCFCSLTIPFTKFHFLSSPVSFIPFKVVFAQLRNVLVFFPSCVQDFSSMWEIVSF